MRLLMLQWGSRVSYRLQVKRLHFRPNQGCCHYLMLITSLGDVKRVIDHTRNSWSYPLLDDISELIAQSESTHWALIERLVKIHV